MSNGFSVNYSALAGVRQSLQDCSDSLELTLQRTGPGCTAAARAYPAHATSAAVSALYTAHSGRVSHHAVTTSGHAVSLQACMDNYRQADAFITEQATGGLQAV